MILTILQCLTFGLGLGIGLRIGEHSIPYLRGLSRLVINPKWSYAQFKGWQWKLQQVHPPGGIPYSRAYCSMIALRELGLMGEGR